jgi:class 3 adenylate cyclase
VRPKSSASWPNAIFDLAEERRLRFRIGVNLGDVIADGGDIYGDGVNIAARLEGLAAPGAICVTQSSTGRPVSRSRSIVKSSTLGPPSKWALKSGL